MSKIKSNSEYGKMADPIADAKLVEERKHLVDTINILISSALSDALADVNQRLGRYEAQPDNVAALHRQIAELKNQLVHERRMVSNLHESILNLSRVAITRT